MSVTRKESIELQCTYASLVRIRTLARQLVEDGIKNEAVEKIIALTDTFHEVPAEIGRGRDLDPELFRKLATRVGMALPADYPFVSTLTEKTS